MVFKKNNDYHIMTEVSKIVELTICSGHILVFWHNYMHT